MFSEFESLKNEKMFSNYNQPLAVGWDSGVTFSLNNFLEDILHPTSFPTALGLKFVELIFRFCFQFKI